MTNVIKEKNLANAWCISAINAQEGFFAAVLYGVNVAINDGNTGSLERMSATVRALSGTNSRVTTSKEKMPFAAPLQRIIAAVFPNAKGRAEKASAYGYKLNGFDKENKAVNQDAIVALESLVGETINGKAFKTSIFKKPEIFSEDMLKLKAQEQEAIDGGDTVKVEQVQGDMVAQEKLEAQDKLIKSFVTKLKTIEGVNLDLVFGEVRKQYNN